VTYTHESDTLEGKFKLWKYHLKELLIDARPEDGSNPRLHESLNEKDVPELWRKLELEYVTSVSGVVQEYKPEKLANAKKTILKCLILLYSNHAMSIGVLQTIPYWLRQLEQQDSQHC
jgi:hypothetical protein